MKMGTIRSLSRYDARACRRQFSDFAVVSMRLKGYSAEAC